MKPPQFGLEANQVKLAYSKNSTSQSSPPTHSFYWIIAVWVARVTLLAFICTFLSWPGIRFLDALTPRIHEREEIGRSS